MKTFKKSIWLLAVLSFLVFPIVVYAKPLVEENVETTPLIYGMNATIRKAKTVNLRAEPSTSSKILTTVSLGEHVTIMDQVGKWFEVYYDGISGFIFWDYISFTKLEIEENPNLIGNSIIHYTSSKNRDTNIAIACETINGIVLQPQKEFRWSNIIGQTTPEKGYVEATVIKNRKPAIDFGGGVCQVSTTIYNALLEACIVPTELHSHSIGCSYAEKDATVAYGYKDFAFVNTYNFPIMIEAYSYKGVVFVRLYAVEDEEY